MEAIPRAVLAGQYLQQHWPAGCSTGTGWRLTVY